MLPLRAILGGRIKETGLDPLALAAAFHQPLPVPQAGLLWELPLLTSPYLTPAAEQTHRHSPIHTYTRPHIRTYTHVHIYI